MLAESIVVEIASSHEMWQAFCFSAVCTAISVAAVRYLLLYLNHVIEGYRNPDTGGRRVLFRSDGELVWWTVLGATGCGMVALIISCLPTA